MSKRTRVGIIGANPERGWAAQAHIPALKSLSDDFEIPALLIALSGVMKLSGNLDQEGSSSARDRRAVQGGDALPQFNERRSVEVRRARAFNRPTTSWPSIERRSPAAARQPLTPRRRRRTARQEREPSLSGPSLPPPSSTRGTAPRTTLADREQWRAPGAPHRSARSPYAATGNRGSP